MKTGFDGFDESPWPALPPGAEVTDWELAAAGYELAMLTAADAARGTMPAAVAAKIASDAKGSLPRPRGGVAPPPAASVGSWIGGGSPLALAAATLAACLGIAFAWRACTVRHDDGPRGGCAATPAPATLGRQVLVTAPDAVTVRWRAGNDPSIAPAAGDARSRDLGDVVWSPSRQQGFVRVRGLAANDPAVEQYQVWIIDADRNASDPVSGGVFDVAPCADDGEVVVAIRPSKPVGRPTAFLVTVETAGGVAVPSRGRIPLMADVP